MTRAIRFIHLSRRAVAIVAAGIAVAASGVASCVTAAPPDLPQLPKRGPHILHTAVTPTASEYLRAFPADGKFIVPVDVTDPTQPIVGRLFVDFFPGADNGLSIYVQPTSSANDGGLTIMEFRLKPRDLGDPNACHIIQVLVADSFSDQPPNNALGSAHTAGDNLGADSIDWFYAPNGPNGCIEFDAGDAAADAPFDGNLLTPDVVGPL